MHLRSNSFKPYDHLDARLAFGTYDPDRHENGNKINA